VETSKTVLEHVDEIRSRLIWCFVFFVLAFVVSWFFAEYILKILILPANNLRFIYVDIMEMFGVYMQVSFVTALILSSPILLYQTIGFLLPALKTQEKKWLWMGLPFTVLCFGGGVIFGYYVLIPPAIQFLTSFGIDIATPQLRIGNYVSLMMGLLMIMGLVFEIPIIAVLLAKLGVMSSKVMLWQWKWALIISFVLGAIITPTWDPINQCLVSIPIFGLYLLSILLVKFFEKFEKKQGGFING
jgi:sec-independent protein translocase protein TatC